MALLDNRAESLYNISMSANIAELDVVQAIRSLTQELPLNDFGLPTGIYRTDLLPYHLWAPHTTPEQVALPPEPEDDALLGEKPLVVAEDPTLELEADPYALLSGAGDGLSDVIRSDITPARRVVPSPDTYRIAGFPATAIQNAFVALQYDEGYPGFEDGRAFWSKMDYEPADAFMAFDRYLKMNFGRRADPEEEGDFGEAASGIRSISTLVSAMFPAVNDAQLLQAIEQYQQYYHLYYWGMRSKAYDLFRITEYKQKQELRAIETQDDHYIQARKLRARLQEYMDDDVEFWELMTPKVAVDMFTKITALERISAGVPASGPQVQEPGGSQSFEYTFRSIAQQRHGEENSSATLDEEGHILDRALEDPVTTEILQELIIRGGAK